MGRVATTWACMALTAQVGAASAAPAAAERDVLPTNAIPTHYFISLTPDPANLRFSGRAILSFDLKQPSAAITVNGVDLHIQSATLTDGTVASISIDAAAQQLSFQFPRTLPVASYQLTVTYRGKIQSAIAGMFVSKYPTAAGERAVVSTQLETSDARRIAPLWDEPQLKSVFELEVIGLSDQLAVSNMPAVSTLKRADGTTATRFQPTPPMSSYLLHFTLGDYERIAASTKSTAGKAELGLVAPRGRAEQGRFALDSSVTLLDYYDDYFGTAYPLPKLDNIAVPGSGYFGAMENWGAIMSFDRFLLLDPATSNDDDRQTTFIILAHEMAHQWFGNLVTVKWWDDVWLNEGFASWMENKATTDLHPEWNAWMLAANANEIAMAEDARSASHPIVQPVRNGEEANNNFDAITYDKSRQVIRMIENYLGADSFRAGIRAYIHAHAYGTATSVELWDALGRAANKPIASIAHDFTEQTGVPLIRVQSVQCDAARNISVVTLNQSRFGADAESIRERNWRVPVTAAIVGHPAAQRIVMGRQPGKLEVPGCGAVKLNVGQVGYYRVAYDAASQRKLATAITGLPAADQRGLLNDSLNLGLAGYAAPSAYLEQVGQIPLSADALVWQGISDSLLYVDRLYADMPGRQRYRNYALARLRPVFEQAGWRNRTSDSDNDRVLRSKLITVLATLGDPRVLAESRRRFLDSLTDDAAAPADIHDAVLRAAGIGADQPTYLEFRRRAAVADSNVMRQDLLLAAAEATDQEIASQVLRDALAVGTPESLSTRIIQVVARQHPQLSWEFATSHYDVLSTRMDSMQKSLFAPAIAARWLSTNAWPQLQRFASATLPSAATAEVTKARAEIEYGLAVRQKRLPELDHWLRTRGV
jgi:puromycin-sensitive aminopeptidase